MLLDNCFDGGGVNSLGLFFKWIQNEFNLLLDKGGAPEKRWPVGSRRPFLCMVVLDHWVDWKDLGCVWCGLQIYLLASWGRKCLYNRFLLTFSYIFSQLYWPCFQGFFFYCKVKLVVEELHWTISCKEEMFQSYFYLFSQVPQEKHPQLNRCGMLQYFRKTCTHLLLHLLISELATWGPAAKRTLKQQTRFPACFPA